MGTEHSLKIPKAIVGAEKRNVSSVLSRGDTVQGKQAANPTLFSGAPVTPPTIGTEVSDLRTKQQATKTDKKATGARNQSLNTLWDSLLLLLAFVNDLCRKSPEQALTIIQASGFEASKLRYAVKLILFAHATTNPGEAAVDVNASLLLPPSGKKHSRKTYLFRHSLDGGKSWINDDSQPVARTVIKGLPPMVEIEIQAAVKDSKGQSDWTQSFKLTLLK